MRQLSHICSEGHCQLDGCGSTIPIQVFHAECTKWCWWWWPMPVQSATDTRSQTRPALGRSLKGQRWMDGWYINWRFCFMHWPTWSECHAFVCILLLCYSWDVCIALDGISCLIPNRIVFFYFRAKQRGKNSTLKTEHMPNTKHCSDKKLLYWASGLGHISGFWVEYFTLHPLSRSSSRDNSKVLKHQSTHDHNLWNGILI